MQTLVRLDQAIANPMIAPPYELVETRYAYLIYFNMLGITEKNIRINVDLEARRLSLFANRYNGTFKDQFCWAFEFPEDADLNGVTVRYKKGAVEVAVPRSRIAVA